MKPESNHTCLHPVKVFNKYLGENIYVPCRKCVNCLVQRGASLSHRVQVEGKLHPYNLFFTLTYDNDHLPVYYDSEDFLVPNRNVCSLYRPIDIARCALPPLPQKWPDDLAPCFGFACKSDFQKFMKRLRSRIHRRCTLYKKILSGKHKRIHLDTFSQEQIHSFQNFIDNEKIRYFVVSEYGPQTLRPHFHGILFTDSYEVSEFVRFHLYSCWKMCHKARCECAYTQGGCASYVAEYLSCFVDSNKVLQLKPVRPFYLASSSPALGTQEFSEEEVLEKVDRGDIGVSVRDELTNEVVVYPLPSRVLSRFLPKCGGFHKKSYRDKLYVYSMLWRLEKATGKPYKEVLGEMSFRPFDRRGDGAFHPGIVDWHDDLACYNYNVTHARRFKNTHLKSLATWRTSNSCFESVNDFVCSQRCLQFCKKYNSIPERYLDLVESAWYQKQQFILKSHFEYEERLAERGFRIWPYTPVNSLAVLDHSLADRANYPLYVVDYDLSTLERSDSYVVRDLDARLRSFHLELRDFYRPDGCFDDERHWRLFSDMSLDRPYNHYCHMKHLESLAKKTHNDVYLSANDGDLYN